MHKEGAFSHDAYNWLHDFLFRGHQSSSLAKKLRPLSHIAQCLFPIDLIGDGNSCTNGLSPRKRKPMKGMFMTRSFLIALLLVTAVAAAAVAGTIEGKISPGKSVVYVDTIQWQDISCPHADTASGAQGYDVQPAHPCNTARDDG
jgi:hypothetical protein